MPTENDIKIQHKQGLYPMLFMLFLILTGMFYRMEGIDWEYTGKSDHILSGIFGLACLIFFFKWIRVAIKHGIWQK